MRVDGKGELNRSFSKAVVALSVDPRILGRAKRRSVFRLNPLSQINHSISEGNNFLYFRDISFLYDALADKNEKKGDRTKQKTEEVPGTAIKNSQIQPAKDAPSSTPVSSLVTISEKLITMFPGMTSEMQLYK